MTTILLVASARSWKKFEKASTAPWQAQRANTLAAHAGRYKPRSRSRIDVPGFPEVDGQFVLVSFQLIGHSPDVAKSNTKLSIDSAILFILRTHSLVAERLELRKSLFESHGSSALLRQPEPLQHLRRWPFERRHRHVSNVP